MILSSLVAAKKRAEEATMLFSGVMVRRPASVVTETIRHDLPNRFK